MRIRDFRDWQQEHGGTYGDYLAYARPLEQIRDELDLITSTLPGTVFWAEDGSEALFLGSDGTYVISVAASGAGGRALTGEAYLVPEPLENLIEASRDMTSSDIAGAKGFSPGWTC